MVGQIKPSVTNPTIADIYQSIKGGRLILKPDFQRKFVWTYEHQEDFIDTILKGFPFPEIYVCQGEIDIENLRTTQFVIDGQQRLTTIKRYIDGEHDKFSQKIPIYAELTKTQRTDFLSYQIVVRDIGKVEEDSVREIFRRINLTKFKLEDIEIHNAVYDGDFIKTAKRVLEHVKLEAYGVFHESEFTRMADLHFILLIMATIENGGYFPQDNEVESCIAKYNDKYSKKDEMKELLINVFKAVDALGLEADSIWFRKSNFFTLITESARNINLIPEDFRARLDDLERKVLLNKATSGSKYSNYYSYMYTGTNGRKARVVRGDIFCEDVFGGSASELSFQSGN